MEIHWRNETKKRYYYMAIKKDLLGDTMLVRCWGGINSKRGRIQYVFCRNKKEAKRIIDEEHVVRKDHGYA